MSNPETAQNAQGAAANEASAISLMIAWCRRMGTWFRSNHRAMGAYVISTAFHAVIVLILSLIILPPDTVEDVYYMIVSTSEIENEKKLDVIEQPEELHDLSVDATPIEVKTETVADINSPVDLDINDLDPALEIKDADFKGPNLKKLLNSHFGGRSRAARAALVAAHGGNAASEAAVASGLKWLARHQNADGSWSFAHVQDKACKASCTRPGSLHSKMGATGLALLAYLGAGQTHDKGSYKAEVQRGLNYLLNHMQRTPDGGDLRGENAGHAGMYIQGLATIALCEAHALTKDRRLRPASQYAINFIVRAQHPTGGGWRYQPRQPGDTSVVGWQVMALQSARAVKLRVPNIVFQGATHFLNRVQADGGGQYGYTSSQAGRPATTAVGLLCRMYLGWKRRHEGLQRGIAYLSKTGPAKNNMYYNYYATQVLHHWGGEEWKKWNAVMRDQLVNTQQKTGHAAGSWAPTDHAEIAGRHYATCMSIMTLEVYYRYLPLYKRKSVSAEF